jgi:hypothetical protein
MTSAPGGDCGDGVVVMVVVELSVIVVIIFVSYIWLLSTQVLIGGGSGRGSADLQVLRLSL